MRNYLQKSRQIFSQIGQKAGRDVLVISGGVGLGGIYETDLFGLFRLADFL